MNRYLYSSIQNIGLKTIKNYSSNITIANSIKKNGLIDNNPIKILRSNSTIIENLNSNLYQQRFVSRKASSGWGNLFNNRKNTNEENEFKDQEQQYFRQQQQHQQGQQYNNYSNSHSSNKNIPIPIPVKIQGGLFNKIINLCFLGAFAASIYFLFFDKSSQAGGGGGSGILSMLGNKNYKLMVQRPKETFKDVVGAEEAKSELQDLVDFLRSPQKYFDRNIVVPKGILLVGPPGTGKTLLAKALAGEANVPFISINGSEFEEVFVGLGAKRVRELFDTARKLAPCIIFIDEIDSVGGARSKRVNYHPSDALNQLLVELDGFKGRESVMVIAATNFQDSLDEALVRSGRFDRKIQVSLPDLYSRQNIIELYLKNKKISKDINTTILAQATPGFSGADLFNLVNWAAIESTRNNSPEISMENMESAKENIIMGKERSSLILNEETRRICAYHEAGHALVALMTEGAKGVHKATIMPRGEALGLVSLLQKDEFFQTKKQYLAEMDVAMGGRAAEELVFGSMNISQGASSDIQKATQIAKTMVLKLGMSEQVGNIYIDSEKKLSSKQRETIDTEIKSILDGSYFRATQILQKYSKEHKSIAEALLEYETLSSDDILQIIANKKLKNKKKRSELLKEREEKKQQRELDYEKSSKIASQKTNAELARLLDELDKKQRLTAEQTQKKKEIQQKIFQQQQHQQPQNQSSSDKQQSIPINRSENKLDTESIPIQIQNKSSPKDK